MENFTGHRKVRMTVITHKRKIEKWNTWMKTWPGNVFGRGSGLSASCKGAHVQLQAPRNLWSLTRSRPTYYKCIWSLWTHRFFSAILAISSISISITGIPHSICSVLISSFNKRICLSKDKLIFPPPREKQECLTAPFFLPSTHYAANNQSWLNDILEKLQS